MPTDKAKARQNMDMLLAAQTLQAPQPEDPESSAQAEYPYYTPCCQEMALVFGSVDGVGNVFDRHFETDETVTLTFSGKEANAVAHAVNHHDHLVADIKAKKERVRLVANMVELELDKIETHERKLVSHDLSALKVLRMRAVCLSQILRLLLN